MAVVFIECILSCLGFYVAKMLITRFAPKDGMMCATKAALRRAFCAFVYCKQLHFQSNYLGLSQPR